MKLAMFGGSFNPLHIGHLIMAEEVRLSYGFDKIIFVPAFISPHKAKITNVAPQHRLNIVKLAIDNNPYFEAESYEIDKGGVSYTIDTVDYLYEKYEPEEYISIILGDDLIDGLPTWHKMDELAAKVNIIIVSREENFLQMKSKMKWDASFLLTPNIDISSSMLRTRFKSGVDCRYLLAERSYEYIKENGLYE